MIKYDDSGVSGYGQPIAMLADVLFMNRLMFVFSAYNHCPCPIKVFGALGWIEL